MDEFWPKNWIKGKKLGRGGQGKTWQVESTVDGSAGVLKKLHSPKDKVARGRMAQEVLSLKRLTDLGAMVPSVLEDNCSSLEDLSVEPYFVMDFIPGDMLQKIVDSNGPFPPEVTFSAILSLCEVLRTAHSAGIYHRDIKPENIIVRSNVPSDLVMVDCNCLAP